MMHEGNISGMKYAPDSFFTPHPCSFRRYDHTLLQLHHRKAKKNSFLSCWANKGKWMNLGSEREIVGPVFPPSTHFETLELPRKITSLYRKTLTTVVANFNFQGVKGTQSHDRLSHSWDHANYTTRLSPTASTFGFHKSVFQMSRKHVLAKANGEPLVSASDCTHPLWLLDRIDRP